VSEKNINDVLGDSLGFVKKLRKDVGHASLDIFWRVGSASVKFSTALIQTRQDSPYDIKEVLEGVGDLFVRIGQFTNETGALGIAQRVQQVVVLLMVNVISGSLAQVLKLSKDESKHVLVLHERAAGQHEWH
jgi:hypothetical protein